MIFLLSYNMRAMNSGWRGPGDITLIAGQYDMHQLDNVCWVVGVHHPNRVGQGGWNMLG
jgi:hypothetical protein